MRLGKDDEAVTYRCPSGGGLDQVRNTLLPPRFVCANPSLASEVGQASSESFPAAFDFMEVAPKVRIDVEEGARTRATPR